MAPRLAFRTLLIPLSLLLLAAQPAIATPAVDLARAQELVDAGKPEAALEILDRHLERSGSDAPALLLRSTARFMIGDQIRGRQDLERTLQLDAGQRQGWLNLGALEIASGRPAEALKAFDKARQLDPEALDNDLNTGAARLFSGQLEAASRDFERYLSRAGDEAEPHYLVAANYAIAGYAALTVEHLRQAVAREERFRLRARTDPNFGALAEHPEFQRFLREDPYRPPPEAHVHRQRYPVAYETEHARLLGAVVDGLRDTGMAFDPRVEVTPDWALIWGDLRIKVTNEKGKNAGGQGVVELSAPAESLTPTQWQQRLDRLLAAIANRLGP